MFKSVRKAYKKHYKEKYVMKKITALLLCALLALSAFVLVGCGGNKEETLKLGLGVYSTATAKDADGETKGSAEAVITVAAVLVDKDGKIVKCVVDTADNKVAYTSDGKAVANDSFKTKHELGDAYGMKNPNYGSAKEWYEHANAFCTLVEGKTVSEVKALVAADGKNTDAVISAGCTIAAEEFVKAVEKAVANAKDSTATKSSTLKLGVATTQEVKDATAEKSGSNKLTTDVFAAALDAEGKIVAATNESVEVDFTFDVTGKSTFNAEKAIEGKREKGDAYGMKNPNYGSAKEWYEHADAFVAACIGKKAGEIASLKGNADLQAAGCTIAIDGFIKAAAKVG
jgi:hypothetical protein